MKLTKKIMTLFLVALLCTFTFASTAFAAEPSITVSKGTAQIGGEVTVDVAISENPGFAALDATIAYNEDVLQLKSIDTTGKLLGQGGMVSPNVTSGKISYMNTANVTGNGVLFSVTFTVLDNAALGDTEVAVNITNCANASAATVSSLVGETKGSVTVVCANHAWDEGTVTKEPTATATGEKTYNCTNEGCDATKKDSIPALGNAGTGNDGTAGGDQTANNGDQTANNDGQTTDNNDQTNNGDQTSNQTGSNVSPKTDDAGNMMALIVMIVVIAGVGGIVVFRKKASAM